MYNCRKYLLKAINSRLNRRFIIVAGFLSLACTMRVSEWVLVNAAAEKYSLIYFHPGELQENVKAQHKELEKALADSNINYKAVSKEGIEQPYYALYYKDRLFSKYENFNQLKNLTSSPLRKKIAGELMDGKLCVMLYLKTGDLAKDARGLQEIQKALNASIFRDIIAVVELSRDSIEEAHFVSMLLNVEPDLKDIHAPMLFGIFGKFKALEPLVAGGISAENVNYLIDYLTAECSCLIKDNLPGADILFAGNWENPKPALLNQIIDINSGNIK